MSQEQMKDRTKDVVESLQETDDCHNRLVDEVSELRAQAIELTTRVNAAEAKAVAAEATPNEAMAMAVAAVEDAENHEEEPAEEQGSQSIFSSAHSAN